MAKEPSEKPGNVAESTPSLGSVVKGADAFELLSQIPELKANYRALERAIDRTQDETLRSLARVEDGLKSSSERHEKSVEAAEARLTKSVDLHRDAIKELGDKINGINWKLALAAGAVTVATSILSPLVPVLWKAVTHK